MLERPTPGAASAREPLAVDCSGRRRTDGGGARDSRPVRGEAGLTTLEWLLVVAAVAVVLVQDVVGGTAEQIDSTDARQTAADLAVTSLAERWRAEVPTDAAQAEQINRRYEHRCRQLGIIYSDISLTAEALRGTYTGGSGWGRSTSTSRHVTSTELLQAAETRDRRAIRLLMVRHRQRGGEPDCLCPSRWVSPRIVETSSMRRRYVTHTTQVRPGVQGRCCADRPGDAKAGR